MQQLAQLTLNLTSWVSYNFALQPRSQVPLSAGRGASNRSPPLRASAAAAAAWGSLPDGVLELVSVSLQDADRLRCSLACRGWRHAFRCAVTGVSANLEAMPRAAQRQLATLDAAFPSATTCRLVFPKYLLPPSDPHGLGAFRSHYRAPLLGSAPTAADPDGASGRSRGVGTSSGHGSSGAGTGAGTLAARHGAEVGRLCAVTELELDLGVAGYTVLVLHSYFHLPALTRLTLRGFSPAAEQAAVAALSGEQGGGTGGGQGSCQGEGQGPGLAAAPPLPALTLRGFPQLQALTLSGTLSYRDIFDVPRVSENETSPLLVCPPRIVRYVCMHGDDRCRGKGSCGSCQASAACCLLLVLILSFECGHTSLPPSASH